jgi:hypothetical protein
MPFVINPSWSFLDFLDNLYAYYRGGGIEGTGYRLNAMRNWLSMAGRTRAVAALAELENAAETDDDEQIAKSLWMSVRSWKDLKKFAASLPEDGAGKKATIKAFVSYKWESGEHVAWVRELSADLRARGIEAILDQWEVRLGESFTEYMQEHIAAADVILFVITPAAVTAAEAPKGQGGALKFEVQMMNARRMAEGTRIIGIYRAGPRPPHYLRDHRYVDFREDSSYEDSLTMLVDDILDRGGAPPVTRA